MCKHASHGRMQAYWVNIAFSRKEVLVNMDTAFCVLDKTRALSGLKIDIRGLKSEKTFCTFRDEQDHFHLIGCRVLCFTPTIVIPLQEPCKKSNTFNSSLFSSDIAWITKLLLLILNPCFTLNVHKLYTTSCIYFPRRLIVLKT